MSSFTSYGLRFGEVTAVLLTVLCAGRWDLRKLNPTSIKMAISTDRNRTEKNRVKSVIGKRSVAMRPEVILVTDSLPFVYLFLDTTSIV